MTTKPRLVQETVGLLLELTVGTTSLHPHLVIPSPTAVHRILNPLAAQGYPIYHMSEAAHRRQKYRDNTATIQVSQAASIPRRDFRQVVWHVLHHVLHP